MEDVSKGMLLLREKHQQLDDEVDRMAEISNLGPMEYQRLKELKVLRLKCRDAIDRVRRENKPDFPDMQPANDPVNW